MPLKCKGKKFESRNTNSEMLMYSKFNTPYCINDFQVCEKPVSIYKVSSQNINKCILFYSVKRLTVMEVPLSLSVQFICRLPNNRHRLTLTYYAGT